VSVLRRRDFRLVLLAIGVSSLGDMIGFIPLALHVHDTTGSGLAVSAFFVAMWGPIVAAAGLAGRLADRVESRTLVLWVSLAQAAVAVALAFSTGSLVAILALTAVLGLGTAVAAPAEFALVPVAAGEDELAVANGHVETVRYAGLTAGPLLGGVLAGVGAIRLALLVDAASFVIAAAAAGALRVRRRAPVDASASAARDRTGTFASLAGDRVVTVAVAGAVSSLAFMSISMTAEVFFAKDVLHAGDLGYGALMTAWTVGMVVGALTLPRRVPSSRLAVAALVAVGVQGAGLAFAAGLAVIGAAAVGYLTGGAAHGAKNVLMRTLLHERVPESRRGRAYAAYNALRNGTEMIALAAGGALVALLGARLSLAVAGVGPIVVAAVALPALVRRRTHLSGRAEATAAGTVV
jgi:MFS family permease